MPDLATLGPNGWVVSNIQPNFGPPGPKGDKGDKGDTGDAGVVVHEASGAVNDPKIWSGVVNTDSNGRFTCDYSIAGFTEPPRVQCNVVGPGQAVANARNASLSAAPTATGCAGIVTAPQSAALGLIPIQLVGAGVPVHVTATGK